MIVAAAPDDTFALESELRASGLTLPTDAELFNLFEIPLNPSSPFDTETLWSVRKRWSRTSTRVVNAKAKKRAKRVKATPERLEHLRAFYGASDVKANELSAFGD